MRDQLVSTQVLHDRLAALEAEVEGQKRMRADGDPFFPVAAWLFAEFREAMRIAALEYRSTSEVARLTGWHPQTLRRAARDVMEAKDPGLQWRGILVKQSAGGDFAFAVSSVPVKHTEPEELRRAG